nr:PREDICTED: uncharacterized protein LOC107076127 isoform X2 [Lepisosteus oculatus]
MSRLPTQGAGTAVREAAGTGAAVRPVGLGDTVVLPCDLQLGYEVMWFVQRDETVFLGLLASKSQAETVNFNYASDSRFSPALNPSTGSIDLRIRNVSRTNLGLFYCAGRCRAGLLSEPAPGSSVRVQERASALKRERAAGGMYRTESGLSWATNPIQSCKHLLTLPACNLREKTTVRLQTSSLSRDASGQDSYSKVCPCVSVS